MELEGVKFDAFISYRHAELDRFVAINLHKKLEKFVLPSSVARKNNMTKRRVERVFRDEEELSLSENLSEPIGNAIKNSEFLICVCTKSYPMSRWCIKEIETFLETHPRDHILVLLAEGEPSEAFPYILTHEKITTIENGKEVTVERETEPLAADCRGKNKNEILKALDVAVMKICATMFGLDYEDLRRRRREQKMKRLMAVMGASAAVFLAFGIVCAVLLGRISSQKAEISDKYASSIASASETLLNQGRREDAIYAARSVLPKSGDYNADAVRALTEALSPYDIDSRYLLGRNIEIESAISDFCVSPSEEYVFLAGENGVNHLFNIDTREEVYSFTGNGIYSEENVCIDINNNLYYSDYNGTFYKELTKPEAVLLTEDSGMIYGCRTDAFGRVFVIYLDRVSCYENGEKKYEIMASEFDIGADDFMLTGDISFSSSGEDAVIPVSKGGDICVCHFRTADGKLSAPVHLNLMSLPVVATNGETDYVLATNVDMFSNEEEPLLIALEAKNGNMLGSIFLDADVYLGMNMTENGLCIRGHRYVYLLDERLYTVAQFVNYQTVLTTKSVGDVLTAFDISGHMYLLGENYPFGMDASYTYFARLPEGNVMNAFAGDKRLIYLYEGADCISVYNTRNGFYDKAEARNYGYLDKFVSGTDALAEIQSLSGVDKDYVSKAFYSDNERVITLCMADKSVRFYDAVSKKLLGTCYSADLLEGEGLTYVSELKSYFMNSGYVCYMFNDSFEYIGKLPRVRDYDMSEGNLILEDKNGELFSVPYLDYGELLEMADKETEGYVMSERIAGEYGIIIKSN